MATSDRNYYSNPAFCQQSEFYHYSLQSSRSPQKGVTRSHSVRQSPVGALSPTHSADNNFDNLQGNLPPKPGLKPSKLECNNDSYEEQSFYEEILVDDNGLIKKKKIVIVPTVDNRNGNFLPRYQRVSNDNYQCQIKDLEDKHNGNRYALVPTDENIQSNTKNQKNRYEYTQFRQGNGNYNLSPSKNRYLQESYELGHRSVHRYAVIPGDEETDFTTDDRYEICQENSRLKYAVIPQQPKQTRQTRYEYIDSINDFPENAIQQPKQMTSPITVRKAENLPATQKLHELLTTPKKTPVKSPQQMTSTNFLNKSIVSDPFVTPNKILRKTSLDRNPKAQQKLNYVLSTRQQHQDKRHTAIVTPICSSPIQSVYSETTYSNKSESWMNLSGQKQPVHATLTVAAFMMIICGGLTSCLCFYMVSFMGRLYFLDFGIVSGFACLLLGLLGCRSRNQYYWLPNRNYMSGYIILTLFSLLTCVGLLVLLFMQPKPGSPLADMTSGAVCGISVLSLILASAGVMASYCCKLPPPDNRVEHCARGFTV
ncbi:hypothetical protein RN001_001040 [Aquatica leii]|uniref:Sanpodo n=1 Tax=Aquatica leii TaxID=1421715 RepID=A0AAN7PFN4_9COLE|nr:hypothetical protein RN001_001040 [Aquatica leii]